MIAMVSNMRPLQSSRAEKCNRGATPLIRAIVALSLVSGAVPLSAQQGTEAPAQPDGRRTADFVKFLAGAAVALAAHESGHLVLDFAFDARPRLKRVSFAGIPFFAITHRGDLSPRREFAISSAGFWTQEAWNEALLTPNL